MKSIKDLCIINESSDKVINIYVQASESMVNSDAYEILEQFVKYHSNFKLTIWSVSVDDILKVKSLRDIKFDGPRPKFDEMYDHMRAHIGETCLFFGN